MAIRKEDGEFICECDGCDQEYYGGTCETFTAFVKEIMEAGWVVRKDGKGYLHTCPYCKEEG